MKMKFCASVLTAAMFSLGASSYANAADADYAVVLKVFSSEFWQTMKTGVEEEAKKQGITVDVYGANTEDDVEGQTTIVENAVNKGYKGIAFAPISSDNLNPALAEATKKGIKLVNIDEMVNLQGLQALGGNIYALVATDNVDVGYMGAKYLVDRIGSKGKVAIIEGKAGTASGEDRKAGATKAFEEVSSVQLVESQPADWDRTKAYDVMTNYISKYPDLAAVYCCNDTMAMGAQAAVNASGKKILVCGTDGNSDAVDSVKRGELAATVRQLPANVGATGLQLLVEAVNAKTAPAEPKKVMVKAELVTK